MPSYDEIRRECKKNGAIFTDKDFPAESSSIFYDRTDDSIGWTRAKDLAENPKFLVDGATKYDIDQGFLGDCWFLAGCSVLSTQKELFEKVVPLDQGFGKDYCGAFRFNFWRFGKWVEVVIDDYLPTKDGKLVFCANRDSPNEFWTALMEKAYAKVHKSYGALEGGQCGDALVDFTGGLSENLLAKALLEDSGKIYDIIKKVFMKNSLLCAVIVNSPTKDPDDPMFETKLDNGLYGGHAYSITDIQKFKLDGETVRLLRIRNPWGNSQEWKGAWSDGSEEWKQCPAKIKKQLDMRERGDGEFWISFEEFCQNFDILQICYLMSQPTKAVRERNEGEVEEWNVKAYHGEWVEGANAGGGNHENGSYFTNPQYYVELKEPNENGTCLLVVSLMQKYTRMMRTTTKADLCDDAQLGIDIYKYNGKVPKELDGFHTDIAEGLKNDELSTSVKLSPGDYASLRERTIRFILEPGLYCVVPHTFTPGRNGKYILRIVTEKPAVTGEIGNETEIDSGKNKTRKKSLFNQMFEKHNGGDNVIDSKELRKILNEGFNIGISVPTCREIITTFTKSKRAVLDRDETKSVWGKIRSLKETFDEYDADNSNSLDASELRKAFASLGYKLGKKAHAAIIKKFCGKSKSLSFDDFAQILFKLSLSNDIFTKKNKKSGTDESLVTLTREELMEMML